MSPNRTRPVDESERKDLLRSVLELPEADRLKFFVHLRGYLDSSLGKPSKADEAILARDQALTDLKRVTEEMRKNDQLGKDQAPTAKQYDEFAKANGISTLSGALTRTFGLWRNATAALLGEEVPEGPAARRERVKRSTRRNQSIGRIRTIRDWLKTDPPFKDRADYDAFAEEANQRLGRQAYPAAASILVTLGIPWADLLEVAGGKATLFEARERRLAEATDGLADEDLIGTGTVALLLGLTSQGVNAAASKDDFPVRVVDLPRLVAWHLGDVKAFAAGETPPVRIQGSMNDEIFISRDIAKILGIHPDYLRTLISKGLWAKVPEPHGQIAQYHFWMRAQVETWLRERDSES
jgi:hypothetical protein